jgi:hypothetical protein
MSTTTDEYRGCYNPLNPHERPLGKFLRGRERHVSDGYQKLRNGQILRDDTVERWRKEDRLMGMLR